MLRIYFDASALVKRYTTETGTLLVNEIFNRLSAAQLTCATIGILEIVSVLVRKHNDGRLPSVLFGQAMLELKQELIENEAFVIMAVEDKALIAALEMIGRHNLNATDAIILRSCLDLQAALPVEQIVLCTSDKRLVRAAHQEKLTVFDPEVDTLAQLEILLHT